MRARLVPLAAAGPLLPAWRRLAAEAIEPNPFVEPAMLGPAATGLPRGADARLLVAESRGGLAWVLPVVRSATYRRVPATATVTWRHPHLALGTPLISPEDPDAAWRAALDLVAGQSVWVAFEDLPLDGPVTESLLRCLEGSGRTWRLFEPWERAVVLRRAEADYLDGRISARHLKALRRQRRRLEDAVGPVHVRDLAADGGWDQGVEEFLELERRGWKGRVGGAVGVDPAQAQWLRETAAALHAEGRLQLFVLCAGERRLAYQVNALAGRTVFHLKVAYDEAFATASPGLQLEIEMVAAFHADARLTRIDSCTAPGTRVSEQLYPDRRPMGTVLVAGNRVGSLAVRGFPRAAAAYDRLRGRDEATPAAGAR